MAKVLIAGCGYVGAHTAARLAREGHEVYGLRRSDGALPPGVTAVRADLLDADALREALPTVSHVVYCAAAGGRSEEAYRDAYVRGLDNLLGVLDDHALERIIFTSSTAVYGDADGALIDERTPTAPEEPTGRILLEAERRVAALGPRGVTLRLAGIYGPGRDRLVRSVADGRARPSPGAFGNRVHLDDCAGALAHLLFLSKPAPVYLGVDDVPAPMDDVHAFLADLLGVVYPPAEAAAETDRPRGRKRCSNALLRASGYRLAVPSYRDGYEDIVAAFLSAQR